MKQLIDISAGFVRAGDIVFNPLARNLLRVEEVYFINHDGEKVVERTKYAAYINIVFSDKLKPIEFSVKYKLYIFVDTENLRVIDNTPGAFAIIPLEKDEL